MYYVLYELEKTSAFSVKDGDQRVIMWLIAYRNLFQEKTRLLVSVLAVSLSIIMMTALIGIYNGIVVQFSRLIEESPTDIVLTQEGINDFFHGVSLIPTDIVEEISAFNDVEVATPIIAQGAVLEEDDAKYDLFLISLRAGDPQAAPWILKEGNTNISGNEIIISSALSDSIGKRLNQSIILKGESFVIKGIAGEASVLGTHNSWVDYEKAKEMTGDNGLVNFVFIKTVNDSRTDELTELINARYPGLTAVDRSTYIQSNQEELNQGFLPVIQVIVIIAFIIGSAVISLTIYTATLEKAKEYGALRALGVTNRQLYKTVIYQSLITTIIGALAGSLMVLAVSRWISSAIASPVIVPAQTLSLILVSSLFMGVIGSFAPIRKISKIDPAEVFD